MKESFYNLLFITLSIGIISGCSSKEEENFLKVYEKNINYHVNLGKTEKVKLNDGNSTKALLTATYLFEKSADKDDTRNEKFIVGLYVDDENGSVDSLEYNLTLKGNFKSGKNSKGVVKYKNKRKAPLSVKHLTKNSPLLKDISFKSEWTKYYLYTFPHTKSKAFQLIFKSKNYGKGKLNFAKASKYVFTKQAL
jgi:hypothetical protein